MVDLVCCLTDFLFFDITSSFHYINLRSSTIFCLFSGDTYLSLGISVSFSTFAELICGEVLETFVILLAILLTVKLRVASAVF